ncbi:hypothetical protein [Lentzea sp. NPDC055074]
MAGALLMHALDRTGAASTVVVDLSRARVWRDRAAGGSTPCFQVSSRVRADLV